MYLLPGLVLYATFVWLTWGALDGAPFLLRTVLLGVAGIGCGTLGVWYWQTTGKQFFSRQRTLVVYRFPVFIPGSGGETRHVDAVGADYIDARRHAMSLVDTSRYIVGPGVEIGAKP